jgi:hypothetical protein
VTALCDAAASRPRHHRHRRAPDEDAPDPQPDPDSPGSSSSWHRLPALQQSALRLLQLGARATLCAGDGISALGLLLLLAEDPRARVVALSDSGSESSDAAESDESSGSDESSSASGSEAEEAVGLLLGAVGHSWQEEDLYCCLPPSMPPHCARAVAAWLERRQHRTLAPYCRTGGAAVRVVERLLAEGSWALLELLLRVLGQRQRGDEGYADELRECCGRQDVATRTVAHPYGCLVLLSGMSQYRY